MMRLISIGSILLILTMVSLSAAIQSFAEEYEPADENSRVFEGRVVEVNTGASTLTVQGAVKIVFPISNYTEIVKETKSMESVDIKLSDIDVGDYVNVEYVLSGLESLKPYKVSKVEVVYKSIE